MKRLFARFLVLLMLMSVFTRPVSAQYNEEPRTIIIPAVNIRLPVEKARIVAETWEVLDNAASFGESTTLPGQVGNTVIFSHAVNSLFGQLPNIKRGDFIYVITDSYTFTYQIKETSSVHPEDISILSSTDEKSLILYTCEGTADERRFAAKAVLIDVSKSCRYDPPLTKNL